MRIHKISFSNLKRPFPKNLMDAILRAIMETLKTEGADVPCEVEVVFTDDQRIRILNREFREVDKSTDVLSFPMQFMEAGDFYADECELSPDTGRLMLGEIVMSLEHVKAQAKEYGNTYAHEAAYLAVHSMLHLLGYDHVDEGEDKRKMRGREKLIMSKLGI